MVQVKRPLGRATVTRAWYNASRTCRKGAWSAAQVDGTSARESATQPCTGHAMRPYSSRPPPEVNPGEQGAGGLDVGDARCRQCTCKDSSIGTPSTSSQLGVGAKSTDANRTQALLHGTVRRVCWRHASSYSCMPSGFSRLPVRAHPLPAPLRLTPPHAPRSPSYASLSRRAFSARNAATHALSSISSARAHCEGAEAAQKKPRLSMAWGSREPGIGGELVSGGRLGSVVQALVERRNSAER